MYLPKRISGPSIEPVVLADLKGAGHLRIPHDAEDDLLEFFITAAREYVETRTGRTLMETTWEVVCDRFPYSDRLELPYAAPLLSVTWVRYTDSDGVVNTWGASNYSVNTDGMPGFITPVYGGTWPSFTPARAGAVRVRYVAGLSTSASPIVLPESGLQQAVRLLVGAMYENREAEVTLDRKAVDTLAFQYGLEAFLSTFQVSYAF